MRRSYLLLPILLLIVTPGLAGTPGSFRGTVVQSPDKEKSAGRWIYVKGKNGMMRRVEISKAKVSYGESVPKTRREEVPDLSLEPGAEIRVIAEQESDGEWHATEIELLGSELDEFDHELPPGHPPIDSSRTNSKI